MLSSNYSSWLRLPSFPYLFILCTLFCNVLSQQNISTPAPLSFSPSQLFDGADGHWSSFIVRIGTPSQNFRVFPAFTTGETIVPLVDGCNITRDPANCGDLRGVYKFHDVPSGGLQVSESSTWSDIGIYSMDIRPDINFTGKGLYGLETVGLMVQNSGGPEQEKMVVAGVKTKTVWTGLFGLGKKPSNFSEFENPQPAYIQGLKNQNLIPSLSYGYTAGAYYKTPKALGSLTLGGYDASRFEPNNQTFPFDANDDRPVSLSIQSIVGKDTLTGVNSFLPQPIYVRIDSTVPHLWLPNTTCDLFASAFGLTFDNRTNLYRVNDTIHEALLKLNPTVTIGLGASLDPAERVNVVFPYSAFDLQATYPIYPNSTNYFPIRRTSNETQYTLGRTFLQEAYVVVDYERGNFSVHQALFPATTVKQEIVAVSSTDVPKDSTTVGATTGNAAQTTTKKGLSRRAVAGIAISAVAFVLFCIFVAIVCVCRQKRKRASLAEKAAIEQSKAAAQSEEGFKRAQVVHEMQEPEPEMDGQHKWELGDGSKQIHQLEDQSEKMRFVHEMPAESAWERKVAEKVTIHLV